MAKTGNPNWQKGQPPPSAIWWNSLTPEEKEAARRKRALKKSMKKAMAEVVNAQQEKWLALFNNAALELMRKAIEERDPQAFATVYDRIVGKPEANVDVTSNGQTVKAPVIIFGTEELDDWKDDK